MARLKQINDVLQQHREITPMKSKTTYWKDCPKPMKPTRIQRKRTAGFKTPPNTCYCGRGSKWGNPFVVGQKNKVTLDDINISVVTRLDLKSCLELYKRWLDIKIEIGELDLTELLKYDHLSCWCSLESKCHVDILIEKLKTLNK